MRAAFHKTFKDRVLDAVRGIKKGETRSYKEVAFLAGRPNAYRAVGNIMSRNHDATVPCHRVVRSDGKPGGYNRGAARKKQLLRREGAGIV